MRFHKAIIDEENKYGYEITEIIPNKWITDTPYAVEQNVFIQDMDNNISFSWVDSSVKEDKDGNYHIVGIEGGVGPKPLKCWMKIPFPHEDFTGWHSEYVIDSDSPRKKNHQYLVCTENNDYGRTTYRMQITRYNPGKHTDWNCSNVIAWRELPKPCRKKVIA